MKHCNSQKILKSLQNRINRDGDEEIDLRDLMKMVSGRGGTNVGGGILDRVKSMLN